MISDKLALLKPISEEATVEEGSKILFKNLEVLQLLQKQKFIETARESLGQETVEKRKDALGNDALTLEDLMNFVNKEPAMNIKTLSNMNVQLSLKESLKFPRFDTRKPLLTFGIQENRESDDSAAYELKIKHLQAEVERQSVVIEGFETEFSRLTTENGFLKEIVKKCKSCQLLLKEVTKLDHLAEQEDIIQIKEEGEEEPEKNDDTKVINLEQRVALLQNENQEFKNVLEQSNSRLESLTQLNSGLEQKLKLFFNENQDVKIKFSNMEEDNEDDAAGKGFPKNVAPFVVNEDINKIYDNITDVGELQNMIKELLEEREELQQQLMNYEEQEELISEEVEQNRHTLEEMQQSIEDFKKIYEIKLVNFERERAMAVQNTESIQTELNEAKLALEEAHILIATLQNKAEQIEPEKIEQKFSALFGLIFQELVSIDFREFLNADEDPLETQLLNLPLDVKLARIKAVILRFFELRDRLNIILTERDELLNKFETTLPENVRSNLNLQSIDQSKTQLMLELDEATAVLEKNQEEIKAMSNFIKQLEYERDSLYRKIEELSSKSNLQSSQLFEWLDGTLEIAFNEEETHSMTTHRKFMELQRIIKEYQNLREQVGEISEEKGRLQITLDRVTNKLRAQQSEIDFLNRQIDIMRNEVASFLKMDEFKSVEKMKSENMGLKQELEEYKIETEDLKNKMGQAKSDLEALRNETQSLNNLLEERERANEGLQIELKAVKATLNEKTTENDVIQKQLRDLTIRNQEVLRLLESEREESHQKELHLRETNRQLNDLNFRFEKTNLLLEHERSESLKKERNLNDLIQQISQLIEKNEKANEQLLHEKEKTRNLEEILKEEQKRNNKLLEQIDALNQHLEVEKKKRLHQDRVISEDLRQQVDYYNKDFERASSQFYNKKTKTNRIVQSTSDYKASEINNKSKPLGKEFTGAKAHEEAVITLKGDYADLLEQNKRLSQTIEELRSGTNESSSQDHLNQKLRNQGLSIPEKIFALTNKAEQIEYLAKEFDKLEYERRKLAVSLEAQKDDSAAKEYVISSLKNQNTALAQSHEALKKIRSETFGIQGVKKDPIRRLEAIKSYFNKGSKLEDILKQELPSAEKELVKKKDNQLFELHEKIQKLLGEFRLRGWDNHAAQDAISDPKIAQNHNEGAANQMNQMMKMMTSLVQVKNEQSPGHETELEKENQKLNTQLLKISNMISNLWEKVKPAIVENKTLKQKIQKLLKCCIEEIETEAKFLQVSIGNTDNTKVLEFLKKLSKKLMSADKNIGNFSLKDEQIKKQFGSLLKEIDIGAENHLDIFEDSFTGELQQEEFIEINSERGKEQKGTKKESKKKAILEDSSQDEAHADEGINLSKKEETAFSNFIKAPRQEKAKNSGLTDVHSAQTGPSMNSAQNFLEQSQQQQHQSYQKYQQFELQQPFISISTQKLFSQPQPEAFIRNQSQTQLIASQTQPQSANASQHNLSKQRSSQDFAVQDSKTLPQEFNRSAISPSLQKLGQVAVTGRGFAQAYFQAYRPDQQNPEHYESSLFETTQPGWKPQIMTEPNIHKNFKPPLKEPASKTNMGYRSNYLEHQRSGLANTKQNEKYGFNFADSIQNYSADSATKSGSNPSSQPNLQDNLRQPDAQFGNQIFKKEAINSGDTLRKKDSMAMFDTSYSTNNEYGYGSARIFKSRLKETHQPSTQPYDQRRVDKYLSRPMEASLREDHQFDPSHRHNKSEMVYYSNQSYQKYKFERNNEPGYTSSRSHMGNENLNQEKLMRRSGPLSARNTEKDKKVPKLNFEKLAEKTRKPKKTDRSKHESEPEVKDAIDEEEERAMKSGDRLMEKAGHILHTIKNLKNYVKTVKSVNEDLIDQVGNFTARDWESAENVSADEYE